MGRSSKANRPPRAGRRRPRWVKLIIFLVYIGVIVELVSRGYFALSKGVSFFAPQPIYLYYPGLQVLDEREAPVTRDDEEINVLLLGGSVLHVDFGPIAESIRDRIANATGRPVVVHNLATPAHTSRDSRDKYHRLGDHRFDLVVFYHAINEVRMNNCTDEMFREDYSHASWHARIYAIDRHPEMPWIVTPYAMHYMWIKIGERSGMRSYLPRYRPEVWVGSVDRIRTEASVRANLQDIIEMAEQRDDPLLVMTFATYVPEGYDYDKVCEEQPEGVNDYAPPGLSNLELWGRARDVMAGVHTHNDVIRELATTSDVHFVDMAAEMEPDGTLYRDVCHLSKSGCDRFVDIMMPTCLRILGAAE